MLQQVRANFALVVYREHAIKRMLQRRITPLMVREAVFCDEAEVIEHYPDDPYGPCCTILGWCQSRQPLHVRISLGRPPYVVTVYDPSADTRNRWEADLKTRRRTAPSQEEE